jgi:hypothetical protein
MKNDIIFHEQILKIKQDLSNFREGKSKSGRIIPQSIRTNILNLHNCGWTVFQLKKEFQIASSAIYRWINASHTKKDNSSSKESINKNDIYSKVKLDRKKSKTVFQKPKRLNIVEETKLYTAHSLLNQEPIQLELLSGIKIKIPSNQISLEFLKSLNTI